MLFEREEPNGKDGKGCLLVHGEAKKDCPILTQREIEVLQLMAKGESNAQIAKRLIISEHTAKAHVCNVLEKFEVHDRVLAVVKAMRLGMLR